MRRQRLVGVPADLLQTFRAAHAILEAGVPLAVPPSHRARWKWLDRYFSGLDWSPTRIGSTNNTVLVDHQRPTTLVGKVERPLLFAHGVANRCELHWKDQRTLRLSFAGLMTRQRERALRPLVEAFGDDFTVISTDTGRTWPRKAWDDSYYETLGRSALTACPDGDFAWSYRFFEAALCGSIPVIESDCSQHEGFRYYRMTDSPSQMEWRSDWAQHNAALARERVTAPIEDLRHEMLIARGRRRSARRKLGP